VVGTEKDSLAEVDREYPWASAVPLEQAATIAATRSQGTDGFLAIAVIFSASVARDGRTRASLLADRVAGSAEARARSDTALTAGSDD
jgi:hypothetical protein